MTRTELILEAAEKMLKVAEDIRSLSDSLQALCMPVVDDLQGTQGETTAEEVPKLVEKPEPQIPLEKIRGVLAEKSRAGFTAEVRDIIKNHGADRLSDIDPKEFPEILKEAEVLK